MIVLSLHLIIWLCWVLVVAYRILSLHCNMQVSWLQCVGFLIAACMWDLVPRPGTEPRLPALGLWTLTPWTTMGSPYNLILVFDSFWINFFLWCEMGFPGDSAGKKPPTMQKTQETLQVRSLGWEDPREEGMATHSSILALENPMDREA